MVESGSDMTNTEKFAQAVKELRVALRSRERALSEYVVYAGIAKCFEVCLEYAWKQIKRELDEQGLEAYSPKDVVKTAGRAGLLDDVEFWIRCINIRNIAVHDYLGVTKEEYLAVISDFLPKASKLLGKISK